MHVLMYIGLWRTVKVNFTQIFAYVAKMFKSKAKPFDCEGGVEPNGLLLHSLSTLQRCFFQYNYITVLLRVFLYSGA